jgi:hypothetical protein
MPHAARTVTTVDTEPRLVARHRGNEVWAAWSEELEAYELFASKDCDDYLGAVCSDWSECKLAAQEHFDDLACR